jgi:hypothetical protein
MTHDFAPTREATEASPTPPAASAPESSQCDTCIHHPYCACRGKTSHCGNYIHRATRVIGGRFDPFRFKA